MHSYCKTYITLQLQDSLFNCVCHLVSPFLHGCLVITQFTGSEPVHTYTMDALSFWQSN